MRIAGLLQWRLISLVLFVNPDEKQVMAMNRKTTKSNTPAFRLRAHQLGRQRRCRQGQRQRQRAAIEAFARSAATSSWASTTMPTCPAGRRVSYRPRQPRWRYRLSLRQIGEILDIDELGALLDAEVLFEGLCWSFRGLLHAKLARQPAECRS
jgi:hypothetical protein